MSSLSINLKYLLSKLNVPKPITKNKHMNYAIYEYLDGNKINIIDAKVLMQGIEFLKKVQIIKNSKNNKIVNAKESCLSIHDLITQIDYKYNSLNNVNNYIKNRNLQNYLNNFYLIKDQIINKIYDTYSKKYIRKKLEKKYQIIHPADFGFHNSLLLNNFMKKI